MNVTGLRCVKCGKRYAEGEVETTCAACGIEGILDVEYDYDRVRLDLGGERSIWRYLPLLPVTGEKGLPTLQVGFTPVLEAPRLAVKLGLAELLLKDDGRLPTGSFKDRAS